MLLLEFLLDNVNVRWWPGPSSIVAHFDCSPRHGDTDAVVRIQRRFVCVCVCVHASRVCVCMLCMRACRPNTIPKSVFLYIYMCVWSVSLMWMAAWKLFAGMTQCTHAPMVRRAYSVTQWKQCASFANFNVLSTQKVFMTDICFVYHQMQIVEGYLPKGPCLTPLPIVPRRSNEILGKLLVTSTKGFFVNIVESSPGIQDILRMVDDGFFLLLLPMNNSSKNLECSGGWPQRGTLSTDIYPAELMPFLFSFIICSTHSTSHARIQRHKIK